MSIHLTFYLAKSGIFYHAETIVTSSKYRYFTKRKTITGIRIPVHISFVYGWRLKNLVNILLVVHTYKCKIPTDWCAFMHQTQTFQCSYRNSSQVALAWSRIHRNLWASQACHLICKSFIIEHKIVGLIHLICHIFLHSCTTASRNETFLLALWSEHIAAGIVHGTNSYEYPCHRAFCWKGSGIPLWPSLSHWESDVWGI